MRVTLTNYTRILFSLVTAVCVLLAGCSNLPMPTAFATHQAPNINIPTGTPRPTETTTPTEIASVMQGTPVPPPSQPITAEAADQLKRLVRWGKGIPQAMAWSKNRATLLVGTTAGLVFFDASSLAEKMFVERTVPVRSVAYSPAGPQLAIGFQDGSVEVWDDTYSVMVRRNPPSGQPVISLSFSKDGNRLAASFWDKSIRQLQISHLFDAKPTVDSGRGITGFTAPVTSMGYDPSNSLLYTFQSGAPIRVKYTEKSGVNRQINLNADTGRNLPVNTCFSTDVEWFAANYGSTIQIQRLADGVATSTLGPFSDPMTALTISPDSKLLAAGSISALNVWQIADGAAVKSFNIPNNGSPMRFLAFSSDGKALAAFSDTLRVWQLDGDSPLEAKTTGFISGYRGAFNFTTDSLAVVLAQLDGAVRVYAMPDGVLRAGLNLPDLHTTGVALSPDNSLAAVISGSKAYVWKTSDGSSVAEMEGQRAMNGGLAFSPDSKYLAAPGQDNAIVVWRLSDQTILGTVTCPQVALKVAFSPDGALLAASSAGVIFIFQLSDGKLRYQVNGYSLAFSADGKTLAVAWGNYDGSRITLYNSADGKTNKEIAADGGSLAFSPDGKLLAVGGNSLVFLQTADGKVVKSLENPAPYGPLVFSPDGRLLGTTGWDGRVFLWGEE